MSRNRWAVLVVSAAALLITAALAFAADPPSPTLAQGAAPFACFSRDGATTCATSRAVNNVISVAVSPDGKFVYAVAEGAVSGVLGSVSVYARDTATGNLTQLPGTSGCLSPNGGDGLGGTTCATAIGIRGARAIVVSPDGKSVYVGASEGTPVETIAVFNRDATTGLLTQPAGAAGCLTSATTNSDPACTTIAGPLNDIRQMVITNDNNFLYAAVPEDPAVATNDGAVLAFSRNPTTSALTQLSGTSGCISNSAAGCATARSLREPTSLALSPDGKQLYVAASEGRATTADTGALVTLQRNALTGVLTQSPGAAGCLNASGDDGSGAGTCATLTTGQSLYDANSIVASPDGKNLYLAAQGSGNLSLQFGTLNVFARDTTTGAVSQPATGACFSQDGSDGRNTPGKCTIGRGMHEPTGVAIAPDGSSVFLASSDAPAAVTSWARDTTGALTQLAGTEGCISVDGTDGATPPGSTCATGTAIEGATALATTAVGACSVYAAVEDVSALASFVCAQQPAVPPTTTTPTTTTPTTTMPTTTTPVVVPPAKKPGLAALDARNVFVLPSAKSCLSKRSFRIRLKLPKGVTPASATVLVNRKRVTTAKGERLTAGVNLKGLPKGTYTVSITLKTADGRSVKATRRYKTCAKKKARR